MQAEVAPAPKPAERRSVRKSITLPSELDKRLQDFMSARGLTNESSIMQTALAEYLAAIAPEPLAR